MSCIDTAALTVGASEPTAHSHNTYQMLFVTAGGVRLRVAGESYAVTAPAVVFLSNLETHALSDMTPEYRRYVVNIRPKEAFSAVRDAARLLSPFADRPTGFSHVLPVSNEAETLEVLFGLLLGEHRAGDFPAGEAALLQTILRLLCRSRPAAFPYCPKAYTPLVRQVKQRLEQDPAADVPLCRLAQDCHVSLSHLSHSFKQATGYSIGRYQLLCRLALAKELLRTTDRPVTAVSEDCGFSDTSNFSRYFRREVGCTPTAYRRSGEQDKGGE